MSAVAVIPPKIRPKDHRAVMASRDRTAGQVDFFPTPPWGARAGAELILRLDPGARTVWEPACGPGHMVHGLTDYFDQVHASDAYCYGAHPLYDFLDRSRRTPFAADWIVTNPPFAQLDQFIRLAYGRARRGVAFLMRLAVQEGERRHGLIRRDCRLAATATFAERLPMHKGRWEAEGSTACAYAWFFWLKPQALAASPARAAIEAAWAIGMNLDGAIAPGTRKRLSRPGDLEFSARAAG